MWLGVGAVACQPSATEVRVASASEAPPGISVFSTGEASAEPDIARTDIGVEVRAAEVEPAVREANQRMNAIVSALKGLGIPEKDLQTHDFSISFERPPHVSPPEPRPLPMPKAEPEAQPKKKAIEDGNYRVTNMLTVTVRDFQKIGAVFDRALEAGANNVWGIRFDLEDPTSLQAEARTKAMTEARRRAEQLAKLGNVRLGNVRSIEETASMQPPMPVAYRMTEQAADSSVPIERGQVSVQTQVRVVYELGEN
jgi:hypothetical protein